MKARITCLDSLNVNTAHHSTLSRAVCETQTYVTDISVKLTLGVSACLQALTRIEVYSGSAKAQLKEKGILVVTDGC